MLSRLVQVVLGRLRQHSGVGAASGLSILLCLSPLPAQVGPRAWQPDSGDTVALKGSVNPRARLENDRGAVEPGKRLPYVTLSIRRSDSQQAALDRLLQEQQDPSSPNLHKWLTPEQFGERFGASQDDLDKLANWLRAQGFVVLSTSRTKSWIVFSGTAGQVRSAFHTEIRRYEVGGKMHFAVAAPPSIPAEFEGLVGGIRGLDDFYPEPPHRWQPMYTAANGTHDLAPSDVTTIYGLSEYQTSGTDTGQSIAIVGDSTVNLADISQFRTTFSLPANTPETVLVGENPGEDASGGMLEAEADLEWAGAIARNATLIYFYAANVMDAVQAAVDQNSAPILSMSYGTCEPQLSNDDSASIRAVAQQANAQGITLVASSGDSGAAACDQAESPEATQGLAVSFPASLPEVTGVGGTEFDEANGNGSGFYWGTNNQFLGSTYAYIPEIAWNDASASVGLAASGGGASVLYPQPAWQTGAGVPANNARNVPDISLSASPYHDPYLVESGGTMYTVGGTSVSTPVFAGILAVESVGLEDPSSGPPDRMGNINPWLYTLAAVKIPGGPTGPAFHDITSGGNIVPCAAGTPDCVNGSLGYSAGPGYDQVTGLGSVDGDYFGLSIATTTALSASATQVMEGSQVMLTAAVVPYYNRGPAAGGVNFLEDGAYVVLNPPPLNSSSTVTVSATLRTGTHSITAQYYGNSPYGPSTSAPVTIVVLPQPPPTPVASSPLDQSTDVAVGADLTFFANEATSYDLYFGTASPPPSWGTVAVGLVAPSGMAPGTKYYWQVVAKNVSGSATSPIWSFTTSPVAFTISTLVGTGGSDGTGSTAGFSGDGGPALQAQVRDPTDVAVDNAGNVYIADTGNHRVRKVTPAGIISTVAGNGSAFNSGDGGPATVAGMSGPNGIAVDSQGNVYVSTGYYTVQPNGSVGSFEQQVRVISSSGIIYTLAGNGSAGYSGDGGAAIAAELNGPSGLATDSSGALFIADTGNGCIRKVAKSVISTVAGQCGVFGSYGDGGPATGAVLWHPEGVAVGSTGSIYIADGCYLDLELYCPGSQRIRMVSNGVINTVAGGGAATDNTGGPALSAFLDFVTGVAVDSSGSLYVTASSSPGYDNVTRICQVANGASSIVAGAWEGAGLYDPGDGGPAFGALFGSVSGIAAGPDGRVYAVDPAFNRVRILTPYSAAPAASISSGGVVNAASFAPGPVAPGSIAAVFGNFQLIGPLSAAAVPVPIALGGLSINLRSPVVVSVDAPIFFASASQTNIQIPWEVAGESQVSILASLNGKSGPAQTLKLAPFAPAIFTTNGQGTGQGAIVDTSYRLVDSSNPAAAGSVIQIYCTGLGAVNNAPATGSPASSTTLSATTTTPTVTIGGVAATVLFSGLAPGRVGEYQVNVQVPAGLGSGTAVPVVVSIGGVSSNTVTMAVH
jgi:uncharacterized protein (TIGR03437 family)